MTNQLVGASLWEEALYEHLTSHEANERELLRTYQEVAEKANSPAFSYLVALIVEDEKRHHQLFRDLASALRADVELRSDQPMVPPLDGWGVDPRLVANLTERLIHREHDDLEELRHLAHDLKDVKDTTLWYLLVKVMEADTHKHIGILEFIRHHARKGH